MAVSSSCKSASIEYSHSLTHTQTHLPNCAYRTSSPHTLELRSLLLEHVSSFGQRNAVAISRSDVHRAELLKNQFFLPARAFIYCTKMNLQTMTPGTIATSLTAHPATRLTARPNSGQLLTHTNSYFHETGRFTAKLKTVFELSCHITIVLNKTANGVLGHGEHLIKGSYPVTGHVEMELNLRQSQKYGLLCVDFRENSYKLSVERWADLFCPVSPTLDYKCGQY